MENYGLNCRTCLLPKLMLACFDAVLPRSEAVLPRSETVLPRSVAVSKFEALLV